MSIRKLISEICIIIFLSTSILPSQVKATEVASVPIPNNAVVFLLDVSGSMEDNDKNRLAIDSIAQLIYSLSSNYTAGVVAYNKEIALETEMVSPPDRDTLISQSEEVLYKGYTNAGEGLMQAMALLDTVSADEKDIVILSDGEILMDTEDKTKESITKFQKGITEAKNNGTNIHVIGLGEEMTDVDSTIFTAAEATGGRAFHVPFAVDVQKAIDSIILEELKIKKSTVATLEATGEIEDIDITFPFSDASVVRILLTSTDPIINLKADYHGNYGKQNSGERYAIIEIEQPTTKEMNLRLQSEVGSRIKIDLIPEYSIVAKAESTYVDTQPYSEEELEASRESEEVLYYNRTATTIIGFYDADNENVQVFTDEYFDKLPLTIHKNETDLAIAIAKGIVELEESVTTKQVHDLEFDFSKIPVNIIYSGDLSVALEAPETIPIPEKDYTVWIIAGILSVLTILILFVVFLLLYLKKKKEVIRLQELEQPRPSKYDYIGKLNIYITKTVSDNDFPPLSFSLFRLVSGRVISLQDILEDCQVKERFQGADKLYFKPGPKRTLILNNQSDCTVMKSREILMKSKSYELVMDAKVDITFEDEQSEMTFQFKDIKPSGLHKR